MDFRSRTQPPGFSAGGRLLSRRTLRKNGRVLMGEQQPAGRPLHPDAREKCARVSRAFADPRDDGELSVIARLHVVVFGVAHRRARRGVSQELRARQGLASLIGPGELLVQERANGFRVLFFEG